MRRGRESTVFDGGKKAFHLNNWTQKIPTRLAKLCVSPFSMADPSR